MFDFIKDFDNLLYKKFDETTEIKKDIVLTAKWEELEKEEKEEPKEEKPKEKAVSSIKLNEKEISLEKGKTFQIKVTYSPSDAKDKTVTYKSSDTSVATVSNKGLVTAKANKTSTATITVTTKNGKTATLKVTASNPVTKATLSKTSGVSSGHAITRHLPNGGRISYKVNLTGEEYESIKWIVEKDGTVPYAALYNCMPNVQQCTIRANALGDDVYKTATLVAQITRKDGTVIEARQKVHVEGLFIITNTSGNDINKTLEIIYEETVTLRVHPNRVNSYTMKSLDPSKIKVTKVNSTDYKISCDPSVELGVPYSVLATSEAGQEYSISVSCFVI